MQERLIREMAKLRGGPAKLKVLCNEYKELIKALEKERDQIADMRDLILKLTSVEILKLTSIEEEEEEKNEDES